MDKYEEYAEFLSKTKWYAQADKENTGELAYHALGLAGEGGEYVDLVKKIIRDHDFNTPLLNLSQALRDRLRGELGDVLWYLTQSAILLDLTIPELMDLNMAKLRIREDTGGRQHVS